jgi:beta-glucosidase
LTEEHTDIARKVAEEGIVLLKNEKDFFPIRPGRYKKIAVIGENAVKKLTEGGGSSELKAHREVSPLQGLVDKYGAEHIVYSMGYASGAPDYSRELPSGYDADSLVRSAVAVAKAADVVLFFGGLNKNFQQDCEGDDRKSMDLPFGQDKLLDEILKVNKNVGVIIVSGNAVSMPWLDKVNGLMQSWYLGSEAGNATARVISGEVSPSGKLPFSIPRRLEDNGAHYFGEKSYPGDGKTIYYMDDIFVGYRWHDTRKIPSLFPFGYGLNPVELVRNMLHTAMEKGNDVKEEIQNILALTLARAAAIVYGQVLSNEEMVSLVDNLFACPSPNYTPDGKTVLTTIKEEDIERLFK